MRTTNELGFFSGNENTETSDLSRNWHEKVIHITLFRYLRDYPRIELLFKIEIFSKSVQLFRLYSIALSFEIPTCKGGKQTSKSYSQAGTYLIGKFINQRQRL